MHVRAVKTPIFHEGDDLAAFVHANVGKLTEGSIVVVASKVVALAESRTTILRSKKEKEALIRQESEWARKILPKWWLTVRDGTAVVNAGLDESNADGRVILLPKDSFKAAERLRAALCREFKLKTLGVIISDSRIIPLRAGVVGVALGYAGFKGVRDYRGEKDLFGRTMEVSQIDVADSLATAATLLMGEGNERQPLAIIADAPIVFRDRVDARELRMDPRGDMYRHAFDPAFRTNGGTRIPLSD